MLFSNIYLKFCMARARWIKRFNRIPTFKKEVVLLLSMETWAEIAEEMLEFYVKKYERSELLRPLISPEAERKLKTTHSPKEVKREAVKIVDSAIGCMRKSSHPRWLIGKGIEGRMERALREIRKCKIIRAEEGRFLEQKQETACTFAVEEIRDMIHQLHSTRWAMIDGCPVPNVSQDEADMRIATLLKDLDLARNLPMLKKTIAENKKWLKEKLEKMK